MDSGKSNLASIVPWDPGYSPDIESAKVSQKKCYEYIKSKICIGEYVDVEGQDSYLYYMARELLFDQKPTADDKTLEEILSCYRNVVRLYSEEKPKVIWYFYHGYFAANFRLNKSNEEILTIFNEYTEFCLKNSFYKSADLNVALYIKLTNCIQETYVPPRLLQFFYSHALNTLLTDVGKKYYDRVLKIIEDILNADFAESRVNFLYKMYNIIYGSLGFDSYDGLHIIDPGRRYFSSVNGTDSIMPFPFLREKIKPIEHVLIPSHDDAKHAEFLKHLLREAENIARAESGLQRVGEGWISETLLYQQIKRAFNNTEVVQHARPHFLGRQHYDIFLPEHNVALEYQGEQHYKAIDYFGGEESLMSNQERDIRKRELSEKNNIIQIDVYPGYDLAELLRDILKKLNMPIANFEIMLDNALNAKANTDAPFKISDSIKTINSNMGNAQKMTEDVEKKMQELLSQKKKSEYAGQDLTMQISFDERRKLDKKYQSLYQLNRTNPERAKKRLKELFDAGYRSYYTYLCMADNYHKLKDYNAELDVLLQGKVDFGYNFDDSIKKILKRM